MFTSYACASLYMSVRQHPHQNNYYRKHKQHRNKQLSTIHSRLIKSPSSINPAPIKATIGTVKHLPDLLHLDCTERSGLCMEIVGGIAMTVGLGMVIGEVVYRIIRRMHR